MNSIELEKGIVHLILPFRVCSGFKSDFSSFRNDLWTETREDIQKLDFLLEHVKAFFAGNSERGETDESACFILKLKPDSVPEKISTTRFSGRAMYHLKSNSQEKVS